MELHFDFKAAGSSVLDHRIIINIQNLVPGNDVQHNIERNAANARALALWLTTLLTPHSIRELVNEFAKLGYKESKEE